MKKIPLTQGKVVLVDDEDFEILNQYKWTAQRCAYTFYAVRRINKEEEERMHRKLINPPKHLQVDHIDGNGLNNQKTNLRYATKSQQQMNAKKRINKISQFKGVSWDGKNKKWKARVKINGKEYWLGRFNNELSAAQAYDKKAKEIFKEYARLNF